MDKYVQRDEVINTLVDKKMFKEHSKYVFEFDWTVSVVFGFYLNQITHSLFIVF